MSNGLYAPPDELARNAAAVPRRWWEKTGPFDLAVSCALVAFAALAYAVLSDGSGLRVALAVSVLFFIPGYLLIEAVAVTTSASRRRATHAWIAIGVSPAFVGLLALATVLLPGGFQGGTIVGVVSTACFGLAGCAYWRRHRASARALKPGSSVARHAA